MSAPLIHNLGTGRGRKFSFTPQPLNHREKRLRCLLNGRLDGRNAMEKKGISRLRRKVNPTSVARSLDCRHRREIKGDTVQKRIDENFLDHSGGMTSLVGFSQGRPYFIFLVRSLRCDRRLSHQFLQASRQ